MTLMINLKDEEEKLLNSKAKAGGVSPEQYAQKLLRDALIADSSSPLPFSDAADGPDDRPIWEIFADSMKDVPTEAPAAIPKDGASQIDHYIYGHPKT